MVHLPHLKGNSHLVAIPDGYGRPDHFGRIISFLQGNESFASSLDPDKGLAGFGRLVNTATTHGTDWKIPYAYGILGGIARLVKRQVVQLNVNFVV